MPYSSHIKRLRRIYHGIQRALGRLSDMLLALVRVLSPGKFPRIGPARGIFSALQLLGSGEVEGRIVMERQQIGNIPSTAMRIAASLNQHLHQPWPIFWTRHRSARLVGETLVLADEKKCLCREAMYEEHYISDPSFRDLILPHSTYLHGPWTSIVARWGEHSYYHWLMDRLPRLALLKEMPCETKVIVPPALRTFQRDSLDWLGLAGRYRETPEKHLLIEDYFFSAPTVMTGCTDPYAVDFLREKFMPHGDKASHGPEKIYIARRAKTRGILNEEAVQSFLKERGWLVVDCETLTLAQQIGLFSGAKQVCGAHGAGFTNILWCPPGCQVTELIPDTRLNGCYESISACIGLDHNYLVLAGDMKSRILVDLPKLKEILEK